MINELHYIDCEKLLPQLADKSVNMILEDMPYNNTDLHFEYAVDLKNYWVERLRVIKDNAVICLTGQQPFVTDIISSCRQFFRYEIIWQKTQKLGFPNANKMPLREHENILIFYKSLPTYNPQKKPSPNPGVGRIRHQIANRFQGYNPSMGENKYIDDGSRHPGSILNISNWNGSLFGKKNPDHIHPTQKPVDLFRWLILTYTNPGDTVFDGFAGSGTTAIACIKEKRNFICCENNDEYFNKAKQRIENAKLQKEFTLDL